jgi:pre-mRNA cleavage complex 2 protein Pcf11
LPSLPSGPPPPSQIGPSSSQVGGPPLVSGLLSNLMQHGIISLQPPSQPQVLICAPHCQSLILFYGYACS